MPARQSTQPAASNPTDPSQSVIGRAPTQIARGAVPPSAPPGPTRPVGPPQADNNATFHRENRMGTYVHGGDGLQTPGSDAKLRLTQGKVIPGTRYKIIRWLGEGGMGVVYEAEHVDIERRVALKILRFDLSQQAHMVKVFKDEAKAAGRLGSQYLVDLYDFGELSDGRLFFVMELLDGHDLVPPDEQYSMDPGTFIAILRQTCKGLGDLRAGQAITIAADQLASAADPMGLSSSGSAGSVYYHLAPLAYLASLEGPGSTYYDRAVRVLGLNCHHADASDTGAISDASLEAIPDDWRDWSWQWDEDPLDVASPGILWIHRQLFWRNDFMQDYHSYRAFTHLATLAASVDPADAACMAR